MRESRSISTLILKLCTDQSRATEVGSNFIDDPRSDHYLKRTIDKARTDFVRSLNLKNC